MEAVNPGMELDPATLIQVQQNFLASARIKEVQLEAAVQQLSIENQRLLSLIPKDGEVTEDALSNADA